MAEFTQIDKRVVTELSLDEARALYIILCHVGGSPEKSIRRYVDSVRVALEEVGIKKTTVLPSNVCRGELFCDNMTIEEARGRYDPEGKVYRLYTSQH